MNETRQNIWRSERKAETFGLKASPAPSHPDPHIQTELVAVSVRAPTEKAMKAKLRYGEMFAPFNLLVTHEDPRG